MTRLPQFVGHTMHNRQCFGDQPLGGRMLLRQTEEAKGQVISLPVLRLRQISSLLQAEQHPEYLGDSAVQEPRDLADRQAAWRAREELQYVQALFKRRRWIAALDCCFGHENPSNYLIRDATS